MNILIALLIHAKIIQPILEIAKIQKIEGPWSGKNFVLTGTLEKFSRPQAHEEIKKRGGHPQSSVTKDTTILVAGEEAGSKMEKAKKLGIEIWDESRFLKELG